MINIEKITTNKTVRTPRGIFYIAEATKDQMREAGFGYHHSSDDGRFLIMTNGTSAYAVEAPSRR